MANTFTVITLVASYTNDCTFGSILLADKATKNYLKSDSKLIAKKQKQCTLGDLYEYLYTKDIWHKVSTSAGYRTEEEVIRICSINPAEFVINIVMAALMTIKDPKSWDSISKIISPVFQDRFASENVWLDIYTHFLLKHMLLYEYIFIDKVLEYTLKRNLKDKAFVTEFTEYRVVYNKWMDIQQSIKTIKTIAEMRDINRQLVQLEKRFKNYNDILHPLEGNAKNIYFKGRPIYKGARGGSYILNKSGKKTYVKY